MTEIPEGEFESWSEITAGTGENQKLQFDDWEPNIPRTNKEIWRYRSLKRYVSILNQEYLWFSRPDKFDDPFEGSLPRKNIEQRHKEYNSSTVDSRSAIRYYYRLTSYVNCWYSEQHESDAMWRLYADTDNGLAIKSTPARLKNALQNSEKSTYGEVEYRDYDSFLIETENPLAPLFYKRNAFKFENEFRILLHYFADDLYGASAENAKEIQPDGLPVPVDVGDLINEVVLSPSSSKEFENNVRRITEEYGYEFNIVKSELEKSPYF